MKSGKRYPEQAVGGRPPHSRLTPDIRDKRQTDRRQTKASINASALWGRKHNRSVTRDVIILRFT